jgi:lipase chaperone LimK
MRTVSRTRASDPAPERASFAGRALLAGALLAGLAGGVHHVLRPGPAAAPAAVAERRAEAAAPARPRPRAASRPAALTAEPAAETLPASLRGTSEDGSLETDDEGDLVLGPGVIRFFDYYLSATGEESPAAIRARVVAAVHRRLPGERAADRAVALFDTYVGYREATRGLSSRDDDPAARLAEVAALRRRFFGAEAAEKLFGREERAMAVALEQRRVQRDPSLSPRERARKLEDLEGRLPPEIREARAALTRPLRERAEEESLRAAGASDEDLHAYRVAVDGEEAADRLDALDQARAAWRARLDAFREARAAIEASQPDPALRAAAVQQLLDASFTPVEQLRVRVLAP